MDYTAADTAIVITDPQNDFLSPDGVTWGLVGNSVTENGTVEHIEALLKTAKARGYDVLYRRITTIRPTVDGSSAARLTNDA